MHVSSLSLNSVSGTQSELLLFIFIVLLSSLRTRFKKVGGNSIGEKEECVDKRKILKLFSSWRVFLSFLHCGCD